MSEGAAGFGAVLGVREVGPVRVTRRYGCSKRDHFEYTLANGGSFPGVFSERVRALGPCSGGAALFVLDLAGRFQLTVAPAAGRAVLVPRMGSTREAQARDGDMVAALLAASVGEGASRET